MLETLYIIGTKNRSSSSDIEERNREGGRNALPSEELGTVNMVQVCIELHNYCIRNN